MQATATSIPLKRRRSTDCGLFLIPSIASLSIHGMRRERRSVIKMHIMLMVNAGLCFFMYFINDFNSLISGSLPSLEINYIIIVIVSKKENWQKRYFLFIISKNWEENYFSFKVKN